jgi:hypothetical protein
MARTIKRSSTKNCNDDNDEDGDVIPIRENKSEKILELLIKNLSDQVVLGQERTEISIDKISKKVDRLQDEFKESSLGLVSTLSTLKERTSTTNETVNSLSSRVDIEGKSIENLMVDVAVIKGKVILFERSCEQKHDEIPTRTEVITLADYKKDREKEDGDQKALESQIQSLDKFKDRIIWWSTGAIAVFFS